MAHFMKLVSQKHLGAINFTSEEDMRPIKRKLTIKCVKAEIPPGSPNREENRRNCVYFNETDKGAFFATKQLKSLANSIMCADTDKWAGVVLEVTCSEVKSTTGGKTMGMIILSATRPPRQGKTVPDSAKQDAPSSATVNNEQPTDILGADPDGA
jgi:hypothetical protein